MPTIIRRAGPDDAPELHDIAARTFALACPPGTTPEDINTFIRTQLSTERFAGYLADDHRILLLAEDGDVPVGYSMLVRGPITDPDVRAVVDQETSVELSKFYVAGASHGTGVAGALMAATLEAATGTGALSCWLGVNQQNVRAARFYEKNGFEIHGTKRFLVGAKWEDDHVRARSLR